ADIEIDGLQAAEGAFGPRQILVGLHRFAGIEMLGRHGCADHVDGIEAGFRLDLLGPALEGPSRISMLRCLAIFRLFSTAATARPISAALRSGECLRRTCAWMRTNSRSVASSSSSRLRARSVAS